MKSPQYDNLFESFSLWRRYVSCSSLSSSYVLTLQCRPWNPADWIDSDDRVRGGSSRSELSCCPTDPTAIFRGNLDIKTLGGAGFASQRTTGEDRNWDVSKYEGVVLDIGDCDKKRYTLTLKDELLPKSPNGREQSTISWEYDFEPTKDERVYIHWNDFKPTYRGREKGDAEPLNLKQIKRISLMMRRYFIPLSNKRELY